MADLLSPEELEEIRQREQAATKGPWLLYSGPLRPEFPTRVHEITTVSGRAVVKWGGFDGVESPKREIASTARFLAHARTDIPRLLAHIEALEKRAEKKDAALRKVISVEAGAVRWTEAFLSYEAAEPLRDIIRQCKEALEGR